MLRASSLLFLAILGSTAATGLLPRDLHDPEPLTFPENYANATTRNNLPPRSLSLDRRQSCGVTQQTCSGGGCCTLDDICCNDNEEGCCPSGSKCVISSGQPGCCPLGQTCSGTPTGCAKTGYTPCVSDNYCCPTGDSCFRDPDGTPRCGDGGGGGNPSPNPPTPNPPTTTPDAPTPDAPPANTPTTSANNPNNLPPITAKKSSTTSAFGTLGTANSGNNNNNNNNNNAPTSGSGRLGVSRTIAALAMGAAAFGAALV